MVLKHDFNGLKYALNNISKSFKQCISSKKTIKKKIIGAQNQLSFRFGAVLKCS